MLLHSYYMGMTHAVVEMSISWLVPVSNAAIEAVHSALSTDDLMFHPSRSLFPCTVILIPRLGLFRIWKYFYFEIRNFTCSLFCGTS